MPDAPTAGGPSDGEASPVLPHDDRCAFGEWQTGAFCTEWWKSATQNGGQRSTKRLLALTASPPTGVTLILAVRCTRFEWRSRLLPRAVSLSFNAAAPGAAKVRLPFATRVRW